MKDTAEHCACVLLQNLNCVETDTGTRRTCTCPACRNLFLVISELDDRRPLVACGKGHTICADCYNERSKLPDGKCPTCGDKLLSMAIINSALLELIEIDASKLEIPVNEIDREEKPFASGGFGKVYNAKWRSEKVVIKVMKTGSEEEKQVVRRETNLTLRLSHPNVIKLFGITWVKTSKLGLVMELAERGSLDEWIGEIDHENVIKIALGIIDGLKYVHSQHVIHRDIKPQNILMFGPKNDMIPKIADFGASKVIKTVIEKHTRIGTLFYVAPEVQMNYKYGFAADIFSLAMTLFDMFNGQLITNAKDEMKRFINDERKLPASCKVPEYLRNVIERGWHKKPEERPSLDEYYSTIHGTILVFLLNI